MSRSAVRNSPPTGINEGLVTPAAMAESPKKKYRLHVQYNSRRKLDNSPAKESIHRTRENGSSLEYIVSQKYRHLHTAVKAKVYTPWQRPVVTKEQESQMTEMEKELAIQAANSAMAKDDQMKEDLEMVVATFSLESLKEIQLHYSSRTPSVKWEKVLEDRDLMDLLKTIASSHDAKQNDIKILEQVGAKLNILNARQMRTESLVAFEKRIDKLDDDMITNGLSGFSEEKKTAIMYRGLLQEYARFKTSVMNECAMNGADHFPKTMGVLLRRSQRDGSSRLKRERHTGYSKMV